MMKNSSILLLVVIGLIAACNTDDDNGNVQQNPGIFAVTEEFAVSAETVDFSNGESVYFTAKFSFPVAWSVKIRGTESGAVCLIDGFNNQLDAGNATWTGNTTTLPLFRNEPCEVILHLPDHPNFGDTLLVNVAAPKVHDGIVFVDFETPLGSHAEPGNFESELSPLTGIRNDMPAGQGEYFYFMEGTDDVLANFFVGLVLIKSSITGSTYAPLPTTNPSELYFNFMLWHDGSPHGIALIQFLYDANNSGSFEGGPNADLTFQFEGDFPLDHTGWRHFSHPMSGTGISAGQLEKLVGIRIILLSNLNTQPIPQEPVRFGIDYMVFTVGGPLEL